MKKFIALLLALAMLFALCACGQTAAPEAPAAAENTTTEPATPAFPTAPITFNLTGKAGSATDTLFRALASNMETTSGVTVVPVTDFWAPSMNATLDAAADGYTICGMPSTNICRSLLDSSDTDDPNYQDMRLLCCIAANGVVLGVSNKAQFKDMTTLQELTEWLKANPDKNILCATGSKSSASNICLSIFIKTLGLENQITVVNSSDDTELNSSVMSGNVDIFVTDCGGASSMLADGYVTLLAVFEDSRDVFIPDVPTARECGIDVFFPIYSVIGVHPDTPQEIQDALIEIIRKATETEEYAEKIKVMGYKVVFLDQEETYQAFDTIMELLTMVRESVGWV